MTIPRLENWRIDSLIRICPRISEGKKNMSQDI